MKNLVSVLVPVFNTVRFLPEALASISAQTYADFELVVIDDGSTDGSTDFLRGYTDPRLRLTIQPNKGLIATRNELLAQARGDLIAWMDSDDVSLPDRLQKQVARFTKGVVCVGTAAQCTDPDGALLNIERYHAGHDAIVREQQNGGAMRFPTTMMRRQAAIDVGGFREPFKMGEDFDLLLRLSEVGKMANLPDALYLYRKHPASVSNVLSGDWIAYRDLILALAGERKKSGRDRLQRGEAVSLAPVPQRAPSMAAWVLCDWVRYAREHGDHWRAWRYARAAVMAQPFKLSIWKSLARAMLMPSA